MVVTIALVNHDMLHNSATFSSEKMVHRWNYMNSIICFGRLLRMYIECFFGLDSYHTISVPANVIDYLELQANGCGETVQT
jgi:hypothetical protein